MSSRSMPPARVRRARLRAAVLVSGVTGVLVLGQAGIASAAPSVTGPGLSAAHGWAQAHSRVPAARTAPVTHTGAAPADAVVRYAHSAFPSVAHLANGSLLVVYRQGSKHYTSRDGFIRSTTSTDLGKTWSASATVIPSAAGIDYRDPSVSTSDDGSTIYLTYFKGTRSNAAAGSFFRSSTDGGATWTHEVRIDPNLRSSAITAPAVQLADGSLVAVHYSKLSAERRDSVWVSRSSNDGVSWTTTRLINGQTADRDYQEPYLVRQGAGLFLTFRWGKRDSIGSMYSRDAGVTWSTPTAAFPGSGRPSSVWLADGTILVYVRDSAGDFDLRVTSDNGATWSASRTVQSPPKGGMSTYASFVETSPGEVFTVMCAEDATGTRSWITFTYLGPDSQNPS